eukprot:2997003-Rhodomonas_salina.2
MRVCDALRLTQSVWSRQIRAELCGNQVAFTPVLPLCYAFVKRYAVMGTWSCAMPWCCPIGIVLHIFWAVWYRDTVRRCRYWYRATRLVWDVRY